MWNTRLVQGKIIVLQDNYPREDEVYLVTIYTGYSAEAGTTANVCIQLCGNINNSRVNLMFIFNFSDAYLHYIIEIITGPLAKHSGV